MKQLLGVLVSALLLVAVPTLALAGQATPAQRKPASPKTIVAIGIVTAVTATTLSVKGKTAEWMFTIDKTTTVTARGATHKSLELKDENKPTTLPHFVKFDDAVTVSYHDLGATKHAVNIRVTTPAK